MSKQLHPFTINTLKDSFYFNHIFVNITNPPQNVMKHFFVVKLTDSFILFQVMAIQ